MKDHSLAWTEVRNETMRAKGEQDIHLTRLNNS